MRPLFLLLLAGTTALPLALGAQSFSTGPCTSEMDGHHHVSFSGSRARFCEVRRATLPLTGGRVAVLGKNGAIEVIGEDRQDVALEAQVSTQADTPAEAQSLAREISIATAGTIEARGPSTANGNPNWAVSFRLRVPHRIAADLRTSNGSITLAALDGTLHVETTNGGLELRDLAGDVHAVTVNGGVTITLSGNRWIGAGLDARSTNGGIEVSLTKPYNAHLQASTIHGGVAVNFPVTVRGSLGSQLETDLGSGGAPIHLQTTNGGISLMAR